MLIVVIMGKWSDASSCWVVHDVRLYSVLQTVVMSGDDVCCSVVFGTLVGVFVFSVMWSELLLYALFNHPRLLIQVARVQKAQFSYRLDGLVP